MHNTSTISHLCSKAMMRKSKKLPMSEHKGHKKHETEHSGDKVDRMSNLPDCILHHILSFMPTKDVVKASILSTRWKNLWAFIPNVDIDDALLYVKEIDDRHPLKITSHLNFVERVLTVRDTSKLEKFRLFCRISADPSQIRSWISKAIMHNLQELDLCIIDMIESVIPSSVFESMSLTTLKIEIEYIKIPSHVSFPSLKTLHLTKVGFMNDDDVQRLFSGCPVLEKLVIEGGLWNVWNLLNNIVISSSTLKSLTIHDHSYFEEDEDPSGCKIKIKINAANLTHFEYIGHLSNEILLINVSSLVNACIGIPLPEERQNEVASRVVDLLKQLQHVVSLRLSNCTMESLTCIDDTPLHIPLFPNLSHLTLTKEIKSYTFLALMNLLYFCPILQSFCLSEGFEECMDLVESDRIWYLIPICVSNCLKTVTFKNFHANDAEICFLKRVLKYGNVLERMDICWSKTRVRDVKKQKEVRKELEKIERSSTICVVKFS